MQQGRVVETLDKRNQSLKSETKIWSKKFVNLILLLPIKPLQF